jgi:hypothetical protein
MTVGSPYPTARCRRATAQPGSNDVARMDEPRTPGTARSSAMAPPVTSRGPQDRVRPGDDPPASRVVGGQGSLRRLTLLMSACTTTVLRVDRDPLRLRGRRDELRGALELSVSEGFGPGARST